jgi:sugar phosphate permease
MVPFMVIFTISKNILLIQLSLFFLGFFIYTPLNFTNSIMVLDVIPKKDSGVATGFVGFFGYLFVLFLLAF